MSLSLKFHTDPSFCWGDIPLFVTVYNLENKTLGFFSSWIMAKSKKIFRLFGTPSGLFLIQLSIKNLNSNRREKKHAILINIKVWRETMKKWHNFLSICILMKFDHMYHLMIWSAHWIDMRRLLNIVFFNSNFMST